MHYALLPYVLGTSFSTHPKPLTRDKKPFQSRRAPLSTFFDTMRLSPFFGSVRLFKFLIFRKIFIAPKGPPINFLIFCTRMDVQKIPKGLPFTFFGTMRLTGDFKKNSEKFFPHAGTVEENTWHFAVLLLFLTLRYGADFGGSRLVRTWKIFKFWRHRNWSFNCGFRRQVRTDQS